MCTALRHCSERRVVMHDVLDPRLALGAWLEQDGRLRLQAFQS